MNIVRLSSLGLLSFILAAPNLHAEPASEARDFPLTLNWPDRRPIEAIFMANSAQNWPGNPRGYFNDSSLDVNTDAGKAKLHDLLMKKADDSIALAKEAGGQGVIVWDIEGDEMPHAITYLGDPRVLPLVAPEMDAIADEFFKKFRDAGLKTGICIRPSSIIFKDPKDPSKYPWIKTRYGHIDGNDPVGVLADKIAYAKKRWGCTLFYMDTDYTPLVVDGKPQRKKDGELEFRMLSAAEMRDLHNRQPDALIFPEFQSIGFFASVSGYKEYFQVGNFSADVRAAYPTGFRVWMPRLSAQDVYEHWDDFVQNGVMGGEVFLFESSPFARLLSNAQADAAMRAKPEKPLATNAPALVEQLNTETGWPERRRIIEALAAFPDATSTAALAGILKTDHTDLDMFAAKSLGKQGTPAALQALTEELNAGKPAGAYGLGASGKLEAMAPLVALLSGEPTGQAINIRWAAIDALGELKRPEAVPILVNFMNSLAGTQAGTSRDKAIYALGAIGDRKAVGPLVEALDNKGFAGPSRQKIVKTLTKITGFDGGGKDVNDVRTWQEWQRVHGA